MTNILLWGSIWFLWLFAIATFFAIRKIVKLLYKLSDDIDLLVMQDALRQGMPRADTGPAKIPVVRMKQQKYTKRTW